MSDAVRQLEQELASIGAAGSALQIPPPCFGAMRGEFLDYEARTMLRARFPVLPEYANPINTMQGGFVAAAMDNVLGPLSYLAARGPCVTLDLSTQFVRGAEPGTMVVVTGTVVTRSASHVLMRGEARSDNGKLIATATSTALILKQSK